MRYLRMAMMLALCLLGTSAAFGQAYPNKPVQARGAVHGRQRDRHPRAHDRPEALGDCGASR